MKHPYTTTCPHCNKQLEIPYNDVAYFVWHLQGLQSAAKRKDRLEHIKHMTSKRWKDSTTRLKPKEQAILELATSVDLTTLTLRDIAARVGITGKNHQQDVWRYLNKLRRKGLLPEKL